MSRVACSDRLVALLFLSSTAQRRARALRQGSGALAEASSLFLRRCFGAGLLFQSVVLYTLKVLRPGFSGQRRALCMLVTCRLCLRAWLYSYACHNHTMHATSEPAACSPPCNSGASYLYRSTSGTR